MKQHITDAGRSKSKRPKQKNDCTVRALSLATKIPYDEAYDILAKFGRKSGRGTDFVTFAKAQPNMVWNSFPAVKGEKRMNISTFLEKFDTDTYIIRTAKHVSVVIDGVLYDDRIAYAGRCVYGAWRVQ